MSCRQIFLLDSRIQSRFPFPSSPGFGFLPIFQEIPVPGCSQIDPHDSADDQTIARVHTIDKRSVVIPVPGCSQIDPHDSGDDQTTTTVEIVDNYKVLQKAVTLVEELPNGSESSKGADISEDSMRDSEMVNPSTTVNKDLDKSEYNLIELLAWFTIKWDKHPQNT